jgi:hypothetical protein
MNARFWGFCVVFLIFGLAACAQITIGDILGTVAESSGAVLVNARVTVQNTETGDTRTAVTNVSGDYVFTLLPIGHSLVRNLISVARYKGSGSIHDVASFTCRRPD